MSASLWNDVDRYFAALLGPTDDVLDAVLAANAAAGLPPADVAPNQGRLLELLVGLAAARTVLEIGTLGGYSTIWLARALPADGKLITIEADPHHAAVAASNLDRAALGDRVELRVGAALEVLPRLADERLPPFDLVFIDADKRNNPEYFAWALTLTRRGSVIVVDNVVRAGAVLDPHSADASVQGVRRLVERVAREPRVRATVLQTVGSKGHDGFLIAQVTADR
jgi:predicted O-methyltransferase YrrM